MTAYLHKNWCGLGDRVIVHPKGLPPGWHESNLDSITRARALEAAGDKPRRGLVVHLDPETFEELDVFPCQ